MELQTITRSSSPTLPLLAFQCLEGLIRKKDHVVGLLGKVRGALPAPSPPSFSSQMNYIGRIITNVRDFCNEINSATLTGAIDVIVVEQPDGSFATSPFHVRFGKIGVLRSREKIVDIEINGKPVNIHMKLGESGEAFFVEEVHEEKDLVPTYLATSPLPTRTDIGEELNKLKASFEQMTIEEERMRVPDVTRSTPAGTSPEAPVTVAPSPVLSGLISPIASACPSCIDSPSGTVTPTVEPRRPSTARAHKPSPQTAKKPKESIGVQTEPSLTGCEENSEDTFAEDPRHPKRKKKKLRRRSKASEEPLRMSPLVPDDEDIFQMDSDYDVDHIITAISVTGASSSSHSPTPQPIVHPTLLSRSVTVPMGIGTPREDWQQLVTPKRLSATYSGGGMHPFSDGDLTPPHSPQVSRPASPKSDTEYENRMMDANSQTEDNTISWTWGELPHIPQKSRFKEAEEARDAETTLKGEPLSSDDEELVKLKRDVANHSMLGGVLSFMKPSTKKVKEETMTEGIYLDDIDPQDLDPEVAALYFPKYRSRQSPRQRDDDVESGNGPSLSQSPISDGGAGQLAALHALDSDSEERHSAFEPPRYYNWNAISPHLLSLAMYHRPLPEKTLNRLADIHMPKKKKRSYSWWSWGRTEAKADGVEKAGSQHSDENLATSDGSDGSDIPAMVKVPELGSEATVPVLRLPNSTNLTKLNVSREAKEDHYTTSASSDTDTHDNVKVSPPREIYKDRDFEDKPRCEKYKKTLRLSSDKIASLNLKSGANEVVFSVTTAYQGTTRCMCHIYLWKHDDKIVISDIDGTITKSDVLGHILPILGKDWAQSGVAKLFTKIRNNGYQFLYLSARAIGQAHLTREYLRSIRQGDLWLPDGPLLLSPTSLINALHREVIEKKPEEFKISCLRDIQTLFNSIPENPFYSGFGNKINDTLAYRAVGIPVSRIFTINHRGELKLELMQNFLSSYNCLSDVADHVFPPLRRRALGDDAGKLATSFLACEEFSSFTYWRDPIPPIEIKIESPTPK
ncbi:phosphatidate phosphatase LPIN3-like isoform X3 [Ornithodoros turicata]|uniref:phosphatidate phosphatase LPIN3-like isoform X3 n=1 Tax=Ornithodoros turicata TaxID=34597 RepID=UPI00313A0198